jgi:hypothetical protein
MARIEKRRPPTKAEQKLVDMVYQFVLTFRDCEGKMTRDDTIAWVTKNLIICGFEGEPCGMLHHLITEVVEYENN